MSKLLLIAVAIGALVPTKTNAEKYSWQYPTVEMPAWHAQAVAIAVREFQKNQGGHDAKGRPVYGDLRHYSVKVISIERDVEVAFIPDFGPEDRKNHTVGGQTQYGIEVSYTISKELTIIKTTFGR